MRFSLLVLLVLALRPAAAQTTWPGQTQRDTVLHDVTFDSGERLSEMRLHAITLGTTHRDTAGHIMLDGIGRGGSAKPSDGLKMAFPHCRYADMVRAAYRQMTEGLGVTRLRLLMGGAPRRTGRDPSHSVYGKRPRLVYCG